LSEAQDDSLKDLIEEEKHMLDEKVDHGKYAFLVLKH